MNQFTRVNKNSPSKLENDRQRLRRISKFVSDLKIKFKKLAETYMKKAKLKSKANFLMILEFIPIRQDKIGQAMKVH
jgi:hypothetical protein